MYIPRNSYTDVLKDKLHSVQRRRLDALLYPKSMCSIPSEGSGENSEGKLTGDNWHPLNMACGTRNVYPGKRNKGLSSIFQPPEKGRCVQRPKLCDKHGNRDEDNSPKNVNKVFCLFRVDSFLEVSFIIVISVSNCSDWIFKLKNINCIDIRGCQGKYV